MLIKKSGIVLLMLMGSLLASAQGFQVNLQGAKQTAMGHAGVALRSDVSSVFFNSGAVSMLEKNGVMLGIQPIMNRTTFLSSAPGATREVNKFKVGTPFHVYAAYGPKEAKWKAGLGIYTPFAGSNDWGTSWKGAAALELLQLSIVYLQPTFSYKLTDKLGIGAGFIYGFGSVNLKRAVPLNDGSGNLGQGDLKGKGNGIGFTAGIFFQPSEKISLGLNYRSRVNAKVENGDAVFRVPSSLSSSFPQPNTFNTTLPLPSSTTLGVAIYPTEKLTVSLQADYVNWTPYDTLKFDYKNNTSALVDTRSPRKYKATFIFRSGVEYKLTDAFAARAGAYYGLTAIDNGYVTPETPDANRIGLSAGLGYRIGDHFNIDATFLFVSIFKRTQTNIESQLSGTFQTYAYIPGLSLGYTF